MIDYYNYPIKSNLNNYNKARRSIIKLFANNKGVKSIYEYGTISAPGISDLDIILVLKKGDKNLFRKQYLKDNKIHELIGSGNIIHMSSKSFSNIKFIDNINVKKIYGQKINIKKPKKSDRLFVDLVSIVDWVPERISRLYQIYKFKKIDIITSLCILNSFSYSIKKSKSIFNFDDRGYSDKINNLRQNWHTIKKNKQELYKLIGDSKKIGERLMFEYSEFLKQKKYFLNNFNNNKKKYNATLNLFIENQIGIGKKGLITIPQIFFYHYGFYASLENFLSKKYKKKLIGYKKFDTNIINSSYRKILNLKITNTNYDHVYLKNYNIKKGLIRFGYLI